MNNILQNTDELATTPLNATGLLTSSSEPNLQSSNRFISFASSVNNIDLRSYAGPILDQGQIGSCMENALVSAIDIAMRLAGHEIMPLSRMQSYADTRDAQHTFNTDSGSAPENTLDLAVSKGLAFESSWAYDPNLLYVHPTQNVVDEAAQHTALGWQQIYLYQAAYGLRNSIAGFLDQGKPVILGFKPHAFFFNEHGPLDQQINFGTDSIDVGHAVVIVGVDDNLNGGSYIVKNSWGTGWGDNGYGTIKYTAFGPNADLIGAFAITGFDGLDFTYSTDRTAVADKYALILGRAGEISGIDFWANAHLSGGQLAQELISSAEGQIIYGGQSDGQFVETMYHTILNRASDSGGLQFYTNLLQHGYTRGDVMSVVIDAIAAPSGEKAAHDLFMNRANVAEYISIAMQYAGGQDGVTHDVLAQVTGDASAMEVIKVGLAHDFSLIG